MADYNVKFTDSTLQPIQVPETEVNDTAVDVPLFGRINLEYGESLDETLLNVLENFACPELGDGTTDILSVEPDISKTTKGQLSSPTIGQFWYNTTRSMIFYWDNTKIIGDHPGWHPLPLRESYAANWGVLADGQQIPRPVSPITGYTFNYDECIWSVSPSNIEGGYINFMSCRTDTQGIVDMKYRMRNGGTIIGGLANYLIIGIKGPIQKFDILPSPTPEPTPSITPEVTTSITPTPTSTPISASPTATPVPSATPTPAPTSSVTPTPGVSATSTPAGTPPVTATRTPAVTRTVTPTPSTSPPIPVTLSCNGTASGISYSADFAYVEATIEYRPNGTCVKMGSTSGIQNGTWLHVGNASDYEIRATQTGLVNSGTAGSTTGAVGTWINMGSTVTWKASVGPMPNPSAVGTVEWNLNLEIRRVSDGVIVATNDVFLYAWIGTPV